MLINLFNQRCAAISIAMFAYALLFVFILHKANCQELRSFPPLFNTAKDQRLSTVPSQTTCGYPERSAYCRSATFVDSISQCRQDYCDQSCPHDLRETLPAYRDLLDASGYGACVTRDTVNVRPGPSLTSEFSSAFSGQSSLCFVTPTTNPNVGDSGAFTLTFWMWQAPQNSGMVVEKVSLSTSSVLLSVQVDASSFTFTYMSSLGERQITFLETLPSDTWLHLAIQVYDTTLSYFLNGVGVGDSAGGTQRLVSSIRDEAGLYRVGQSHTGDSQFQGRIQDLHFYSLTLTNREISEVYTGVFPEVHVQSACRCPPSHPRLKPDQTQLCIANGLPDNTGEEVSRLNEDAHPLQYLNDDNTNSLWISAFLNDVSIEVDLGSQFQVFYVVLQFYSPQPKVVTIEKRASAGSGWERWQMYAEDCQQAFGMDNNGALPEPTSVNCIQFGTNGLEVPYSKGNITFNVLAQSPVARPGHNDFYNTPELAEFVKASHVRVRLQGHYYVEHSRHKYYGIYEYIVTGRCNCHGHAEECDHSDLTYQCKCHEDSYTTGDQCQFCLPLYNDKPFRAGDQLNAYNCKACQCYDHADSCIYDVTLDPFPDDHERGGGGRCVLCQHNTMGQRCDSCMAFYFRPVGRSLYAEDVCEECNCNTAGVEGGDMSCEVVGGQCSCKQFATGRTCDRCQSGYYNLQLSNPVGCEPCACNPAGSVNVDVACQAITGICSCKRFVIGAKCDECQYGYYNLDTGNPDGCQPCDCNPIGALDQYCNPDTGQCNCQPNILGQRCDQCADGFFDFADQCRQPCNCWTQGTESDTVCDKATGQCVCKAYVMGRECSECKDGYFSLGSNATHGCMSCGCDAAGMLDTSEICDKVTGECLCKVNVQAGLCNKCLPNTWNLTADNPDGCESCGCDPGGTMRGDQVAPNQLTCEQNTGQCTCLMHRSGRTCDTCARDFYLNREPGGGCNPCNCFLVGTIRATTCDSVTGQCVCKPGDFGVGGRACDTCATGYWGFDDLNGECKRCDCDQAGSVNATCLVTNGQCPCKDFTVERQCGVCVLGTSNLQASNPYGCSKAPSQQPPPEYEALSSTALRLYWQAPDYPNGLILLYNLYRDGRVIATVEPANATYTEYNDTGLFAYTEYSYSVEAVNSNGEAISPVIVIRTPAGTPSGDLILQVLNVGSRSASFSWNQPMEANGQILYYQLTSTTSRDPAPLIHYKGLERFRMVEALTPYMDYTFVPSACTAGGCLSGEGVLVVTDQDMPEGQLPPNVTGLSTTELYISWQPPVYPNGIIIFYELWMRGSLNSDSIHDPEARRIFHPAGWYNPLPSVGSQEDPLPPPDMNYTVGDLMPYAVYEFQVFSENSQGKVASDWASGTTLEAEPVYQPAPQVKAVSSSAFSLTWDSPTREQALGEIVSYAVHLHKASDLKTNPHAPPFVWTELFTGGSSNRSFLAEGFQPYSQHTFRVEACNSVGCVNSSDTVATTLADAPGDQAPPMVSGYNSSTMQVTWPPVENPNGPHVEYQLHRMTPAFSNPPPLVTAGTRFPGNGYYKFPPTTIPQGVAFTGFSLWFKTEESDGLILFAASEGGQEEFVAVQIRSGRPWFLFDPQGCPVAVTPNTMDDNITFSDGEWHYLLAERVITTATIIIDSVYTGCSVMINTEDDEGLPYNDGRWHHMLAIREGKNGTLLMDSLWRGSKQGDCTTGNIIGDNTGVYIGGLPDDYILQRVEEDSRAQVNNYNFIGCIRDLQILTQQSPEEVWIPLDWDARLDVEGAMPSWEGCPTSLERALHFMGTGYTIYDQDFPRANLLFTLELRTQLASGLLFFAYGAKDVFILIQLVSGGLHVEFSDDGPREVLLVPASETVNICDGLWHEIEIEKKEQKLTAIIDGSEQYATGSERLLSSLWLASKLYMGGIKPDSDATRFIEENGIGDRLQRSFGGCMKELRVARRTLKLIEDNVGLSGVNMDGCPSIFGTYEPCISSSSQVVYTGTDTSFSDGELLPFTQYLYQVEASNDFGSAMSPYRVGRTREGAPEGVSEPYNVFARSGYIIEASWRHPTGRTGYIMHYILRAYEVLDDTVPPVEATFENTTYTFGVINGTRPYTNYSVVFVACSRAGCTESQESAYVFTAEEAPSGVSPPVLLDAGGTYVFIGWQPPEYFNGQLTGYFLFWENRELYGGGQNQYNVTGLSIYTTYRFYVRACTRVGCTDSETVRISTAQLPPTYMAPPSLLVMGTDRIRVDWERPSQLNGVLERYLLYASTQASLLGEVTYNNTDLFLYYVMEDLLAGTAYYIAVGACTGGGCTVSESSTATTVESAPSGVGNPVATSPSPSELLVTWSLPEYPNGVITQYRLYHNGLLVFSHPSQRQHLITGLAAWSYHLLRLEACTSTGCSSSDEIEARTQEAPPEGTVGLDLLVDGPRTVSVNWNPVQTPNGMVLYEVYFEGLYYVDPGNWNYNTATDRRVLYETEVAGSWHGVTSLIPYSTYSVQVNASNSAGFTLSNVKEAEMPMGSPDGVKPPVLSSPSSTTIRAVWENVGRSNANQEPAFQLQFKQLTPRVVIEDLFQQPTTSTSFMKGGLQPFTQYEFRLIAINAYGETLTEWTALTTKQDKPSSIDPPMTGNVDTRSLEVFWSAPLQPNGLVTHYNIYQDQQFLARVDGNVTRYTVEGLTPFTSYSFQIEACTIAGCMVSAPSSVVTTLKAPPEGVPAPTVLAQSPTSVLIVWNEPRQPNGDILQYSIRRRLLGDDIVTLVETFTPDEPREYIDSDRVLTPYTTYEYSIGAFTAAGQGYSDWVAVTTKSSGPGGVRPPNVQVLSPTSAEVVWDRPLQPNGNLEYYIIKFPSPRFEVTNISVTYLMVEDLVPYTEYFVTVTACSDGGCTESMATRVTTSPAIPSGVDPPAGTPHSQTFISVLWNTPEYPNGPNIRYELLRMKLSQPLDPSAVAFNIWISIYTGTDTYHEDRGLTMYTTYQYRVSVYNDFGHMTSNPSEEVTTFGGNPTKAATVTLHTVNHTAIEVTWLTPTIFELQGGVSKFTVAVTDSLTVIIKDFDPDVSSAIINELEPNTRYGATVTITVHGGATITSEQAYTTTQDGAPVGVAPPYLHMINETALRVIWTEPDQPNGEILAYNLYVDDMKIETGYSTAASYVLSGLEPYTIYMVQVEVCTEYACVKSSPTQGTTAESVPSGVSSPSLTVQGPQMITVTWTLPAQLNGILLRYELLMKAKIPCSSRPKPTVAPPAGKCTYYECGIMESFCAGRCYSGPKVCCEGELYEIRTGYECCRRRYVPQRAAFDDVCCGGQYYPRLEGHQCCGERYVAVDEGEACCVDPSEDRVAVGYGDKCCNAVPYTANGSQTCCGGRLYDAYSQQCCGGQLVPRQMQCCGDGVTGMAYTKDGDRQCCGTEYMVISTSVCCVDADTGRTRVHTYSSESSKLSSGEKCCAIERISNGLSCCSGIGYNPETQVCADVSNQDSGCGTGVTCSIHDASSAFCNRCNFEQGRQKCGSVKAPYLSLEPESETDAGNDQALMCVTEPVKIYTGMDYTFTHTELTPYTEYQFAVVAINAAGGTMSDYSSAVTAQSLPEGVEAPEVEVKPDQLYAVYLRWQPPSKPNGEVLWYIIIRDGLEIFRDPATLEHVDNNAIQPYQTYIYSLQVCNGAGCVSSSSVKIATLQAKPSDVYPPNIVALSSTSLQVTWPSPGQPNGFIVRYELYMASKGLIASVPGSTRQYTITELEPYKVYEITLSACTDVGCSNSTSVTGRTLQDKPEGVRAPQLVVQDANTVEVHWQPPLEMNGLLSSYRIYRALENHSWSVVYMGDATALEFVDPTLNPGSYYQYKLEVVTGGGATNSTDTSIVMPARTPTGIPAPSVVRVLNATSIYVEWELLESSDDFIDQYKVMLNAGTVTETEYPAALANFLAIGNLQPYTEYSIRIQACVGGIFNGCGTGPAVTVTTWEAPPEGQQPPSLAAVGSSSVAISWSPPQRPNGIILQYHIHRRLSGSDNQGLLINVLAGAVTAFTNVGPDLLPYTWYDYKVTARNSEGDSISKWATVQTLEAPPQVLYAPVVTMVGAYSVMLSWEPPLQTNGKILLYEVQYREVSNDPTSQPLTKTVTVPGSVLGTSVSGLQPYMPHEVRIMAENSAGEVASAWTRTTTSEAAPSGLGLFSVEQLSSGTAVILRWEPPTESNGIITGYLIYEVGSVNAVYQGLGREFEYRRLQPYTAYDLQLEACTSAGCAKSQEQTVWTAEVVPDNQPVPSIGSYNATHVILEWTSPVNSYGRILQYDVLRRINGRIQKRNTEADMAVVVFTTQDTDRDLYTYVDSGLQPYTSYEYKIRAANSAGSVDSAWQAVETSQAAPQGVHPPRVSQISSQHDRLQVEWSPPDQANGIIQTYQIRRNASVPWSFGPYDAMEYTDVGLVAYTYYAYTLTVRTGGGFTTSEAIIVRTPESAPHYIAPPTVAVLSSTGLYITWTAPQITNGEIRTYHLEMDGDVVYSGLDLFYQVEGLVPYVQYTFSVSACTLGGCTESDSVIGRPLEAEPEVMQAPVLRVLGSHSIEIAWEPPERPNGIITSYEVRRDGTLIQTVESSTANLQHIDYDVEPGQTYTYIVTAFNSEGEVSSPPASARTYASSPQGLERPQVTPLSATSVVAVWAAPLKPNGDIYNYTLYVDNRVEFSGKELSTTVAQLQPWTEYSFRVQACTNQGCTLSAQTLVRTLEAAPSDLQAPILMPYADVHGAHAGVMVRWGLPRLTNGNISRYEVYRRRTSDGLAGDTVLVYTGLATQTLDTSITLLPYTQYDYRITAYNSVGHVNSEWATVLTKEAPPEGVPEPVVKSTTTTTIIIELLDPAQPNGYIEHYNVYLNGQLIIKSRSTRIDIGETDPLKPYTLYTIYVEACTAGGCTQSPSVQAQTQSSTPEGVQPPVVANITATSLEVFWSAPSEPNGQVVEYELYMQSSCPHPYADGDDQVTIPCEDGFYSTIAKGLQLYAHVSQLRPYSRYQFKLDVRNEAGGMEDPPTVSTNTLPAEPQYNKEEPPKLEPDSSIVNVDWTQSFFINGEVTDFTLYKDGNVQYMGYATDHNVPRDSLYKTYELQVRLRTTHGEVNTPVIIFDPSAPDYWPRPDPDPTKSEVSDDDIPVYQEVWFIALIALLALAILFIALAVCIRRTSHKVPYLRERVPLQPKQKKLMVPQYCVNPYGDSIIGNDEPVPLPNGHVGHAHPGYANPAFSHMSLPSRPGSLVDLNLDKLSQTSWAEGDDDEVEPVWDQPVHRNDSGLHSLAYGDDYDGDSDRPISVLKEHTMFSDTHI